MLNNCFPLGYLLFQVPFLYLLVLEIKKRPKNDQERMKGKEGRERKSPGTLRHHHESEARLKQRVPTWERN
jgi:hypothetical protein